jgi:hypothetical protein
MVLLVIHNAVRKPPLTVENRLGLMLVQGQRKAAAEYIQATSRVPEWSMDHWTARTGQRETDAYRNYPAPGVVRGPWTHGPGWTARTGQEIDWRT